MIYSPSLMCSNCDSLRDEVLALEAAGANRLHIDVMDVKSICRNTSLVTELHMMIKDPGRYIKLFADAGVDIIYIHPDSARRPKKVIQKIRDLGKSPGIVINPEASIESMQEYYDLVDNILVMGVKPGNAGHIYLSHVDQKLEKLIDLRANSSWNIILDGACTLDRMKRWSKQGVDGFVLGTSSLFGHHNSYKDIIDNIKRECGV